jgi:hypothetical protein
MELRDLPGLPVLLVLREFKGQKETQELLVPPDLQGRKVLLALGST